MVRSMSERPAVATRQPKHTEQPTLFELRTYETRPGRRDDLIAMFEQTFLDAYESNGARILATWRDLDDPDRWTWIRAFRDAPARGAALAGFYESAAWKAGSRACNATIAKTRSALLLRLFSGSAIAAAPRRSSAAKSIIVADIHVLPARSEAAFAAFFTSEVAPALRDLGAAPFATLLTDRSENTFPRQRVRKATTFVTLTRFVSRDACDAFRKARDASAVWRSRAAPEIARRLSAPIETHRLQPTARSALR